MRVVSLSGPDSFYIKSGKIAIVIPQVTAGSARHNRLQHMTNDEGTR